MINKVNKIKIINKLVSHIPPTLRQLSRIITSGTLLRYVERAYVLVTHRQFDNKQQKCNLCTQNAHELKHVKLSFTFVIVRSIQSKLNYFKVIAGSDLK